MHNTNVAMTFAQTKCNKFGFSAYSNYKCIWKNASSINLNQISLHRADFLKSNMFVCSSIIDRTFNLLVKANKMEAENFLHCFNLIELMGFYITDFCCRSIYHFINLLIGLP